MKRFVILLILIFLMFGCGSMTKINKTSYKGDSGYSISGKVKRLDRSKGLFTVQVDIEEIWYEGYVNVYKDRGVMLGYFKESIKKYPHMEKKSKKLSLYDHDDKLDIRVLVVSENNNESSVPFRKVILSDNLMKFTVDSNVFLPSKTDVIVYFSLGGKSSASTMKKSRRKYGDVNESSVELNSEIKLCLTCAANKGV